VLDLFTLTKVTCSGHTKILQPTICNCLNKHNT